MSFLPTNDEEFYEQYAEKKNVSRKSNPLET